MALAHCDTCTLTELCPIVLLHSRPVGQRHRPLGQRTATRWGCRKVANGWKRSVSLSHKYANGAGALRHVHAHGALPHRAAALSPCWTTSSASWPANSDTMGLQEGRQRVETVCFAVAQVGMALAHCDTCTRTATRRTLKLHYPIVLLHSRSVGQRHRPLGQRTATRWGCRKVANGWKRSVSLSHQWEWRWAHCDTCTLTELHCPIVLLHSRPVGQRHRPLGQRTATRWGCRKVANGWKRSVSLLHKYEWRWRTATRARSRSFAPSCCCTLALLDNVIGHLANEQRHDGAVGRSPTGGIGLFRCCTSRNGAGALRHVHAHGALPHRAAALSPCWTTSSATWPANSDTMGL